MKVAVCQLDIKYEDKEYNLARAKEFIEDAANQGADIIFFPEMSFTGFSMDTELTGEEDLHTQSLMEEYAEEFGIAIGFGWVEHQTESENHYTVIDSDGEMIADYLKIHLFEDAGEDEHFVPGYEVVTFTVDVIDWPAVRMDDWRQIIRDRATELNSYMIGVNCYGEQEEHYSGFSCVIGPNGEELFEIEDMEDMVIVDIEKVE